MESSNYNTKDKHSNHFAFNNSYTSIFPKINYIIIDDLGKNTDELFCPICYKIQKNYFRPDKCNHKFCGKCLNKWSKINKICPICRIKFSNIIKI
jgi:hypothetical protein